MYAIRTDNMIDNQPETLSAGDAPPLVHNGYHKVKTIQVVIDLKKTKINLKSHHNIQHNNKNT